jgi:mono/diheme cytochrome c family protein
MKKTLILCALGLMVPFAAQAADGARQQILDDFAAQARQENPAFDGFSAQRGDALFRTRWATGDERTPSCTACHTENPTQLGRNAKTGRAIDPVAVSVNAKRFTDSETVAKQFKRDCNSVLGRACTAQEKGDYITFMAGQ